MKPHLTLIHGWGWHSGIWRMLLPLLDNNNPEICDLGYSGSPSLPVASQQPRILITHSFGALWWLKRNQLPWHRLIVINGFARFAASSAFPHGVAMRTIKRMATRFNEEPAAVLKTFHQQCGDEGKGDFPYHKIHHPGLQKGLEDLMTLDALEQWQSRAKDIWLLWSQQDKIVPPAASQAFADMLPAGHAQCITEGGHLLPLTHPHQCAQWINTILKT